MSAFVREAVRRHLHACKDVVRSMQLQGLREARHRPADPNEYPVPCREGLADVDETLVPLDDVEA